MLNNNNNNLILENKIDNHIDNIILQEFKLSSLNPKRIMSYSDDVIKNSFKFFIKSISTILTGGVVGGIIGVIVTGVRKTLEKPEPIKEDSFIVKCLNDFKNKLLNLPPKPQQTEEIKTFTDNIKEAFKFEGENHIVAGIVLGLVLSFISIVLIKKRKLSKKEATEKTINMVKKASLKSDKDVKKVINKTINEYKKVDMIKT
jgi:hypothetical protein